MCAPTGSRTPVLALRGPRPRPLDDESLRRQNTASRCAKILPCSLAPKVNAHRVRRGGGTIPIRIKNLFTSGQPSNILEAPDLTPVLFSSPPYLMQAMPKDTRSQRITIIFTDPKSVDEMKGWLKPYSPLVQINAFNSLRVAVPMLEKFPADQLIVADRFPEASGLSLYKGLRSLSPQAQVYMLAAEQTPMPELRAAGKPDTGLRYFTRPWDQHSLLTQLEANLVYESPVYTVATILEESQQREISRQLDELQESLSARSICLMTDLGQVLAYKGDTGLAQIGKISLLLGGSFAALQQVGLTLGDLGPANSLIQRQSETEDMYVIGVAERALLFLLFPHSQSTPRLGTITYYTRHTVQALAKILSPQANDGASLLAAASAAKAGALAQDQKREAERLLSFTKA